MKRVSSNRWNVNTLEYKVSKEKSEKMVSLMFAKIYQIWGSIYSTEF